LTNNQRYLRGIQGGTPTAKTTRRLLTRGRSYLAPYRATQDANLRRAAERVRLRADAAKLCQGPKS